MYCCTCIYQLIHVLLHMQSRERLRLDLLRVVPGLRALLRSSLWPEDINFKCVLSVLGQLFVPGLQLPNVWNVDVLGMLCNDMHPLVARAVLRQQVVGMWVVSAAHSCPLRENGPGSSGVCGQLATTC